MTVHVGHSIPVTSDETGVKAKILIMNNPNSSNLTYTKVGNYYIPNLALDNQPDKEVGMADTKVKPIKNILRKVLGYIENPDKMDGRSNPSIPHRE